MPETRGPEFRQKSQMPGPAEREKQQPGEAQGPSISRRGCSPRQNNTEKRGAGQRRLRALLAEKLASVWTGGVDGRKGAWPAKKERRERSHRSGERCCAGMFSQLPTLLWIFRFKGLLFFLALQGRQSEEEGQRACPGQATGSRPRP